MTEPMTSAEHTEIWLRSQHPEANTSWLAYTAVPRLLSELSRVKAERDAAVNQLREVYQFALEKQEETANADLFDAMWSIRAMTGSTETCADNQSGTEPGGEDGK